ncbi:MAG: hypothetical protein MUP44_06390 [Anaerolineales bacterium]|nr:hypothetical protein [Anaerolineales bacterium]
MNLGNNVVVRIRALLAEQGLVSLGRLRDAAAHIERIVNEEAAKENASKAKTRAKRAAFTPPTPEEVTEYSVSIGYPMDGESWCAHYEAKDWKISGSTKMTNWKAAVRNWKGKGWKLEGAPTRKLQNGQIEYREVVGWKEFLMERTAQGLFKDTMPEAWENVSGPLRGVINGQAKYCAQLAEFASQNAQEWQDRLARLRSGS